MIIFYASKKFMPGTVKQISTTTENWGYTIGYPYLT